MIWLLSIFTVCICILSAPLRAQEPEKVFRIGIGQEFDSLNPLATSMLSAYYVYNIAGRNLVSLDHQMNCQPQLAEEVPSFKNKLAEIKTVNGNKRLVSVWNIRQNAKWGDGVDVTCEDVKFTWTVGRSNFATVIVRETYMDIESIKCDSKKPKRVEMIHAAIKWDFYKLFQFYILPKHTEEAIFNKFANEKEGFDRNTNYVKNPTMPGLYNGPFVVSEIKLGSHILFKRNPHFFGKKPFFDKILVRLISDTATLEANLISKQVDMVSTIGFNMDQALNLEKRVQKEGLPIRVDFVPGFAYEHIDLNLDNPILKDVNVRKALLLALDREKMVQSLFEGKQPVAPHFLSPRDPWFEKLPSKLKKPIAYSKKDAEKLLDNAGWKMNADGFRYKDGQKFTLVFSTTSANRLRESIQTYIIDQWQKVGIHATIKNVIARTFFSDLMTHRKYEATAMFSWTFLPEVSPRRFYSSENIPTETNGWAGRNYPGYRDEKLDGLLEQLDIEMSQSKRQSIINQVVDIYRESHMTVPLYYRVDIAALPKDLKGYYSTGTQQLETLFIENWEK